MKPTIANVNALEVAVVACTLGTFAAAFRTALDLIHDL